MLNPMKKPPGLMARAACFNGLFKMIRREQTPARLRAGAAPSGRPCLLGSTQKKELIQGNQNGVSRNVH